MNVQELLTSDKDVIYLTDIAEILGSDPATLRETVRQNPDALKPLEPITIGNRMKVSRMRVLGWLYGTGVIPVEHRS